MAENLFLPGDDDVNGFFLSQIDNFLFSNVRKGEGAICHKHDQGVMKFRNASQDLFPLGTG